MMQRREWNYREDKVDWGDGPWVKEPDKIQWEYKGMPCLIVRGPMGALCGYVGVGKQHPLYEQDGGDLSAHGGITFTSHCQQDDREHGVCHIPDPGEEDNLWWFGFDCAHYGDFIPKMDFDLKELRKLHPELQKSYDEVKAFAKKHRIEPLMSETYRDIAYVTKEVQRLANQLRKDSVRESPTTL